jgi:hypothetical protein
MNIEGRTIRLRAVEPGDVDLMFLPASTKFYELDGAHAEE